jgi:hypothetical protein
MEVADSGECLYIECHKPIHLNLGLASGILLGKCIRESVNADLCCFNSTCKYTNRSEERMHVHIQKEHNKSKKTQSKVTLFPNSDSTPLEDRRRKTAVRDIRDSSESLSGEGLDASNIRSARRGRSHLQTRPTPYDRNTDGSSQSRSPTRKSSLGSLSPLRISSPHPHLLTLSAGPSPLNQIAFSHPNSPLSDDKMDIDEDEAPSQSETPLEGEASSDDDEVLAKGSLAIIPLHQLGILPPIKIIACTKCLHGILPSSALSHALEHKINLSKVEKQNIKQIIESGRFAMYTNDVALPPYPGPPIEGIKIQNGFICKLCNFCCPSDQTMVTHFGSMHKGIPGHSKAHSEPASIQAYFAQRPRYFKVLPILHGQSEDDLFSVYLRQCAPPIEGLTVLNSPLDPNEVPPLLKVTQWHEHLRVYTADRGKIRKLLELTTLPTSNRGEAWIGSTLRATIEGYMRDVRGMANNASIGIKCLLKECPRFVAPSMPGFKSNQVSRTTQNGQHWVPLGNDTLRNYSILLHQWTHAILLTVDNHDSGYSFPLTEGDISRAQTS